MRKETKSNLIVKKKFTDEDKIKYCRDWQQTGISKSAFCQATGLSKSAFYLWHKQFEKELLDDGAFLPITLKTQATVKPSAIQLEVRLPNQAQLFLTMQQSFLIPFIQELCHAATIIR